MDVADPITPSVKALVDLFKNELSAVTFPGVDGALLEQLLADVQKYTDAVLKAEAAVEAARAALRESEEALAIKSQKALAYARVYAEDRPDIAAKVDFVARVAGVPTTPSDTPKRERDAGSDAPKRRGRKPRVTAADTSGETSGETTDATPLAPPVEMADLTPMVSSVTEVSVEEIDASVLDGVVN